MHVPLDESRQQQVSGAVYGLFRRVSSADTDDDAILHGDVARLIFHCAEVCEFCVFEQQVAGLFAQRAFK